MNHFAEACLRRSQIAAACQRQSSPSRRGKRALRRCAGVERLETREMLSLPGMLEPTNLGTLTATEGVAFSGTVAIFRDPNHVLPKNDDTYSAFIDWGTGGNGPIHDPGAPVLSVGTISGPDVLGSYTITGSHTYAEESATPLTVNVRVYETISGLTQSVIGASTDTMTVADAPLSAGTVSVQVGEPEHVTVASVTTTAALTGLTATFTDANPDAAASDFTANINWGDGTTTAGSVSAEDGGFRVFGTHVYGRTLELVQRKESDIITVTVDDNGGSTSTMTAKRPESSHHGGGNAGTVFKTLLGRSADNAAMSYYSSKLANGVTLDDVAASITDSDEFYINQVIQPVYKQVLGRAATTDETDALLKKTPHEGRRTLEGQITLTRDMPAQGADANTFGQWLDLVFQADNGRTADKSAQMYFYSQFQSGKSPLEISMEIADSPESTSRLINAEFNQFGNRSPTKEELQYWSAQSSTQGLTQKLAEKITADDTAINSLFDDLLGRSAENAALGYYSNLLDRGASVQNVADSIVHNVEYNVSHIVQPLFDGLLGRPAAAADASYWAKQLDNGMNVETVEAHLLASDEFYTAASGTDQKWIDAVYEKLFGRTIEPAAETYWLNRLSSLETGQSAGKAQLTPAEARLRVAVLISNSVENNTQIIDAIYADLSQHSPTQQEVKFWLEQTRQDGGIHTGLLAELLTIANDDLSGV
ncbi:MAG TPA: DUF4214 domain-containing protein [Pirellulales bacterium]|nr:DUF4214 domain-containing protein [Pirellulales bacterium]